MIQTTKKMINLPVFTVSGKEIGHLIDLNIDTDSQSVISYSVKSHHTIVGIFNNELIINRGQIVDILPDKIIASDNFPPHEDKEKNLLKKKKQAVSAIEKNS
ncbi:MAG: hypothetical protein UV02_C0056G0011 [Candidatus Kuenenbacteria bacterium GW2011_GWA2_42_15]|uniref:PRC-barrel domain-containing protein n=2 Tax=Patescibacteria group TaxID=1783273 RepID=A0A0G0YT07_9BACT|nr:MAG: hypothetical protein UV02_C0056G0011 [Candidatus Kuenenbacteria bacterium GW2011_GWA2_42_15]